MSNIGSSHTFIDLLSNFFPLWRDGSICTWSVRFAVMLRKWLGLNEAKPPVLHDKLCRRLYFANQLHMFGKRDKGHPEYIFTRSQNSFFGKLCPSSFSDRVHIHVDVPFSCLMLFKRILLVGKSIIKVWSLSFFSFANSTLLILYLVDCSKWFDGYSGILVLCLALSAKNNNFIPSSFTGNNSSFYSMLLGLCPSIRAGIKNFSTLWSSFCKHWEISGIVFMV